MHLISLLKVIEGNEISTSIVSRVVRLSWLVERILDLSGISEVTQRYLLLMQSHFIFSARFWQIAPIDRVGLQGRQLATAGDCLRVQLAVLPLLALAVIVATSFASTSAS